MKHGRVSLFLFIPVGHEGAKNRRFPFACLAIIVACLIAFGNTWPQHEEQEEGFEKCIGGILQETMLLAAREGGREGGFSAAIQDAMGGGDPRSFLEKVEKAIAESDADDEDLGWIRDEVRKARTFLDDGVFHRYGLVTAAPRLLPFLTHMFLHAGYLHLIFNIIFFILVGPALEDLWGRPAFATVTIISGLAAAAGFWLIAGTSDVPLVGASGAIAGLMGSFLVAFTFTRIKILGVVFLLFFVRIFTFSVPAWVFLPLWAGWEVVQGIVQLGSVGGAAGGGVAHWAHVAGFAFGVAVPFAFRLTGLERFLFPAFTKRTGKDSRASDPAIRYEMDPGRAKALRLGEDGDWAGAEEIFLRLSERYAETAGPRLDLAELYREAGEEERRRDVLLDALEVVARTRDERAAQVFEVLRRDFPKAKVPAETLLRTGIAYERAGKHTEAIECLRRIIDRFPDHPIRARAMVRAADIFSGPLGNPVEAKRLLEEAMKDEASETLWREEARRRLGFTGEGVACAAPAGRASEAAPPPRTPPPRGPRSPRR